MDDEVLVDEVVEILPKIGKLLHTPVINHPLSVGRSYGQLRTLMCLYLRGQRTVGELASELGLSMPTVSEMVDRLVEEGLAERQTNPADRRQVLVGPTAAAIRYGQEIHELKRAQIRAVIERLTPDDRPVFLRSLKTLADVLQESAANQEQDHAACPRSAVPRD